MYVYNTSIIYTYVLLFAEGAKVLLDTDTAGIGLYTQSTYHLFDSFRGVTTNPEFRIE